MPFVFNPIHGTFDAVKDVSAYVPYVGATANVVLGARNLSATDITATGKLITPTTILMTGDDVSIGSGNTLGAFPGNNVIIGFESSADYFFNTAVGTSSSATGAITTVVGSLSSATGDYATALGSQSQAGGQDSIAIGGNTYDGSTYGIVIGRNSHQYGFVSTLIGYLSENRGNHSFGFGNALKIDHNNTMLFNLQNGFSSSPKTLSRTSEAFQFSFMTDSVQHDIMHVELGKGVRIGNYTGETITMTGQDLYVDGHTESKGKIWGQNDIELTTAATGVILKSPNGTRYKVTVDNSGTLVTTAL